MNRADVAWLWLTETEVLFTDVEVDSSRGTTMMTQMQDVETESEVIGFLILNRSTMLDNDSEVEIDVDTANSEVETGFRRRHWFGCWYWFDAEIITLIPM